jgi:hypothetical protein
MGPAIGFLFFMAIIVLVIWGLSGQLGKRGTESQRQEIESLRRRVKALTDGEDSDVAKLRQEVAGQSETIDEFNELLDKLLTQCTEPTDITKFVGNPYDSIRDTIIYERPKRRHKSIE